MVYTNNIEQLIFEAMGAVKDANGNITVGTNVPVPSTNTTTNQNQNVGVSGINNPSSGSTGNVTNVANNKSVNGTNNNATTAPQNLQEWVYTYMINDKQRDTEVPSYYQEFDFEYMVYLSEDYTNIYNTAIKLFLKQLEFGNFARYLVQEIGRTTGIKNYVTEETISALDKFVKDNANKVFKGNVDNNLFNINYAFKTNFDGWNMAIEGTLVHTINGELKDNKVMVNVTKKNIKSPTLED